MEYRRTFVAIRRSITVAGGCFACLIWSDVSLAEQDLPCLIPVTQLLLLGHPVCLGCFLGMWSWHSHHGMERVPSRPRVDLGIHQTSCTDPSRRAHQYYCTLIEVNVCFSSLYDIHRLCFDQSISGFEQLFGSLTIDSS
jgi:hypothetical protein